MAGLSPMMQQYMRLKEQHKDMVLFFRLGDFYEMFFDDAITVSKELELTLTGRECGLSERAPMCGVPYHSAETYIARLLELGHKVAICEQTGDPATSKGLVDREVVRIITQGTALESSMLNDDRNNFLCSIFVEDNLKAGICFSDVSCGIIYLCKIDSDKLVQEICNELSRFSPTEIIANDLILKHKELTGYIKQNISCSVEIIDDDIYNEIKSKEILKNQFPSDCYKSLLSDGSLAVGAIASLIHYLTLTQKRGLGALINVEKYSVESFMKISPMTRKHLEITQTMRGASRSGSLLNTIDMTQTSMGRRLLRLWFEQPLISSSMINRRLDAVGEFNTKVLERGTIRELLSKISDMERILSRIVFKSSSPRELYSFLSTLTVIPELKLSVAGFTAPEIISIYKCIDNLKDIQALIFETLSEKAPINVRDGNAIKDGFNAEIDELRSLSKGAKFKLTELENKYREDYGFKKIKIGYNRVFGYYVELPKYQIEELPPGFVRRQTLTNGERYITEELKELEVKIMGAQERLINLETEIYDELLTKVSASASRISTTAASIARLDVLCCLAEVAMQYDYVRPIVDDSTILLIKNGRHPVVERLLRRAAFIANDVTADNAKNRILLITGPNMAGKSTYMRQTALIVLLAQVGSFVPAASAQIGVCDSILTRVGASDDLSAGQSTFMVEMTEMAQILETATSKSLLILDEIGRGTSTFDGLAIARAIVEYLAENNNNLKPKTMFATHYHELCTLENIFYGVKNYSITAKKRGDELIFLRKIVGRAADDSYGIEVAKLAGIPNSIIKRAGEILIELEQHSEALSGVATQIGFDDMLSNEQQKTKQDVVNKLKSVIPDTLSPLEAWQILSELKEMTKEEVET